MVFVSGVGVPSRLVVMESAVEEEVDSTCELLLITNCVLDAVGLLAVGKEGRGVIFLLVFGFLVSIK